MQYRRTRVTGIQKERNVSYRQSKVRPKGPGMRGGSTPIWTEAKEMIAAGHMLFIPGMGTYRVAPTFGTDRRVGRDNIVRSHEDIRDGKFGVYVWMEAR